MYFGTVNRMIFAELMKVFLLSLVALTGMFMLAGMIQEASQKGLSPAQIVMAIPLIIPNTLPFTIPATTLFATCVVYGRMSADNEILVLRAAGINIYHVLWPALLLGVGTSLTTGALYYDTIPRSQTLLREQLLKDSDNLIHGMIKREGGMRQSNLDFVLYVRDVQGRDLIDVVVKKRRPDKLGFELVARAQVARIRIRSVGEGQAEKPKEDEKELTAIEKLKRRRAATGTGGDRKELVVYMDRCFVDSLKGDAAADLQHQEYTTPLPEALFGKDPRDRPSAQTWQELFVNRTEARALRDEIAAEAAAIRAQGKPTQEYEFALKDSTRKVRQYDTEIQMRPALSLGCLAFVLIGCPVGIWASRSDYLSVFIICFMPTVFIYYPVLLAGINLAKDGKFPAYATWAADVLALLASFVLIRKLMKR